MLAKLKSELNKLSNPQKAKILQRFFKTGKGEYGEGDIFLGIIVPISRKIAIKYKDLEFDDIKKLLHSKIHEERLIALFILVYNFQKGNNADREKIYKFYLSNTKYVNNWDLVDLSADKIVGAYLLELKVKSKRENILTKLAKSQNIWERRIAVLATFQFIKNKIPDDALKIAGVLLNDKYDLIQKAVGWMLREVGKRCSQEIEEEFLQKHYKQMPRTMLRYAIERFPQATRKRYLEGNI